MYNWFPLGLAAGKNFCNRQAERKYLTYNIEHGIHSLIIAPRRYGKTSLAEKVIADLKIPMSMMEFTLASDHYTTQNIMNEAIGQLLIQLMPTHKKALILANKYFSRLNPKLIIDTQLGAKIELTPEIKKLQQSITELLINVDLAAGEAKKRVILFMDEFQQIAALEDAPTIEAAIRNAAQRMKNTSLIFSGSSRHILEDMFEDPSRPFYHLCERINLMRIETEHYIPYIQHASKERWSVFLDEEIISQILDLTQCHPYYVNVLCSRLWREDFPPDDQRIEAAWADYIKEEHFQIGNALSKLSQHQKLMLMIAAIKGFTQPTSKKVISQMRASVGSAAKTFKYLLQQDYIYSGVDGFYKIVDPAIETFLKKTAVNVIG